MIYAMKAALFDLDGVLVDTAKYHFLAWQRLAEKLSIPFTHDDNEALKGVSRMASLNYILALGGVTLSEQESHELAELKNRWYVELISGINESEALPGAVDYLGYLRSSGIKIALGSASRNARLILDGMGITSLFHAIVDGTVVSASKPDPEVFLEGARRLAMAPAACVVFEDSRAGLLAARRGAMYSVGIGLPGSLPEADMVVPDLKSLLPLSAVA